MATRLKFLQRFQSAITDFLKTRKFTDRPGHRTKYHALETFQVVWLFDLLKNSESKNRRFRCFEKKRKKRFRELLVFANIHELAVFVKEPMDRKVISCMFENFETQGSVTKSVFICQAWMLSRYN